MLTLLPIIPATCDGHCQAPGACQDEEENEKYKIGLQGKAVDGSFAMTLLLNHIPSFYLNTYSNL